MSLDPELHKIAALCAQENHLPIQLVEAIITVESGGRPYCWRYESHYRYLWDVRQGKPFRALTMTERGSDAPPADFFGLPGTHAATEWIGQQASWGCTQIMGAVAREYGYKRDFTELCLPENGILYGCYHLKTLARRFGADWRDVAAAYNAGSPRLTPKGEYENQVYVDKVEKAGGFG